MMKVEQSNKNSDIIPDDLNYAQLLAMEERHAWESELKVGLESEHIAKLDELKQIRLEFEEKLGRLGDRYVI